LRAAIIGIALAILALAQRLGAYENKPLALLSAIIGAGLLAYAALSWVLHWRGSLTIHRSIYGSDFGGKDVTEQIRMHIKDGKVCEKIDSDLLGDPTPNQFKSLKVEYSFKGKRLTKVVQQDNWCTLP
jgi:hypothetical protein